MGIVTSAFASLIVFVPLPFILPLLDLSWPTQEIIIIALLTGVIIQINQTLYFQALSHSEAGIIAAYWNMTPIMVTLLSFFIFGHILLLPHYIGIAVLVTSSVFMCLLDSNIKGKWHSFNLILIGTILQAVALILMEKIFRESEYLSGFFLITFGFVIAGFAPLIIPKARITLKKNFHTLISLKYFFLAIEICNLIAYACIELAVSLKNAPLVSAIDSATPGFTFVVSLVLLFASKRFKNPHTRKFYWLKLGNVGVMVTGVWLLSIE
ncbi:MAG: EamA-like transporter family [Candidatus Peregrinibacteria bacterium Greene0416_19]|nr:MAG: EamA-like transporter family [Candidatus Peregrinibacteria bacterium Greene0416_19]